MGAPVCVPSDGADTAHIRVPRSPVESYMFANTGSDDVPDLAVGRAARE